MVRVRDRVRVWVRVRVRVRVRLRLRVRVRVRVASDLARGIRADAFGRFRKVPPFCPPSPMYTE